MMRKTKLFTVEEHEVMAGDVVWYSRQRCSVDDVLRCRDEFIMPVADKVPCHIHHIRKIEHGQQKDSFIALSPELNEIIYAPINTKVVVLTNDLATQKRISDSYKSRIDAYNALPWYKRWFKEV